MLNLITVRTEEPMPLANTKESTAVMQLAGESRVGEGKTKSLPLGSILYRRGYQVEKPAVELPAGAPADVLLLGLGLEVQVLKNQHGILRSPLAEFSGGFPTERPVAVVGFPGQPFQHSAYRLGVEVLCLLPGEFGLQTRANLPSLGVANGESLATDEERILVCGGDEGVVHPKVNADRYDTLGFKNLKGDAEGSLAVGDAKAVNALGQVEVMAEVLGDFPADFLPAPQGGDGEAAVSAKREVLGEKEKGSWFAKDERTSCWPVVGFSRSIGGGGSPDGVATHLRSQGGRGLVVDQFVQFIGTKRLAAVEADRADGLLVTVELGDGFVNESVPVKDYRYGSLDVHADSIVIHLEKSSSIWKYFSG